MFINVTDIDVMWDKFRDVFLKLSDKHAPYVSVRKKVKGSPWITSAYKELARDSDYCKSQFHKIKCDNFRNENKTTALWKKYTSLRNKANILNKKLKKAYYRSKIESSKDMKESWNIVKELLPDNKANQCSHIVIEGEIVSDPLKIATEFNTMFSNIFQSIHGEEGSHEIKDNGVNAIKRLSKVQSRFVFKEITTEFVKKKELNNLDCSKSVGLDDLHPRLLKLSAQLVVISIVRIFNQSIQSGRIPNDFKMANIVPIPKTKTSHELSDFRPISLLSTVSKVLERAVHSQLMEYLYNEELMSDRQSGFRSKHSTSTCLTEMCELLYDNLDKGRFTGAVFLDLIKAFDIIPHDLLIKKIGYFGISGTELSWFESYLVGRNQCVSYKGIRSDFLPVHSGVPQGSILGPLLFCMYINDICNLALHSTTNISLYADDTAIFSSGYGVQAVQTQLQNDILVLCEWMNENGLVVNTDKTKVMLFSSRRKKNQVKLQIKMNGKLIENVTKFKYLGVIVNQNLDWSPHVNEVVKRIMNSLICMRRIKHCLTKRVFTHLYYF